VTGAPWVLQGHAIGTLCFAFHTKGEGVDDGYQEDDPETKRFIETQASRLAKALEVLLPPSRAAPDPPTGAQPGAVALAIEEVE
jgi:hypothetical protein